MYGHGLLCWECSKSYSIYTTFITNIGINNKTCIFGESKTFINLFLDNKVRGCGYPLIRGSGAGHLIMPSFLYLPWAEVTELFSSGLSSGGSLPAFAGSGWSLRSLEGSCGTSWLEKGLHPLEALSLAVSSCHISECPYLALSARGRMGRPGQPTGTSANKQTKQLIRGHVNSNSFFTLFHTV